MAAVLPRPPSEFGLFRPEFSALPTVIEPACSVSLFQRYSPASFAMYNSPYPPSPDPNQTRQPCSPPHADSHRSVAPVYSSSPTHLESATKLCRSSSPLVSARGMIVVLDFTPSEGEADTPVTVNLELRSNAADDKDFSQDMSLTSLKLRLVFGRTAVKTTVRRLPPLLLTDMKDGPEQKSSLHLQLRASAPLHSDVRFPEQFCVPLTIQAMDGSTKVVESFTFGSFTYWAPTTIRPTAMVDFPQLPTVASPARNKRKRVDDDTEQRSLTPGPSQSPPTFGSPRKALALPPRADKGFKLARTTNLTTEELNGADAQPAILEWVVENGMPHPNTLDKKWSAHELAVGRRLIRFGREMSGNKLCISCEVIPQEAYDEEHIVISCVYRQETRNCWFTSVDIIYLLERLVGGPFSVEEKNRIRRNLEGFKPTTVSKTKGGFEMFFQRIMDFPPPKPRNIEKDVKVFPWHLLAPAVDKIISKYSVLPSSDTDSPQLSQDSSSTPSSSQVHRTTRSGRSRSISSNSLVLTQGDDAGHVKSLRSGPSQQPLHMVVESPPMIDPELTAHMPEPNSVQGPLDHYYFPGLTFPEEDQWRRRDSIVPLDSQPHEFYPGHEPHDLHATPGPLDPQAFSNPFASDVSFGTMTFSSHVPHGHGLDIPAGAAHNDLHGHGLHFDSEFAADDVFASRRSSLASDLMYPPMSASPGSGTSHHDTMTVAYDADTTTPTQDSATATHNAPHDYFLASSLNLPSCSPISQTLYHRSFESPAVPTPRKMLIFSLFKTLTDQTVTVELKNDLSITGVLKSVDQFLNIRLDNIKVMDEAHHPHMMPVKNCFIRGSVVRYVQLPAQHVDTQLLEDATRRGMYYLFQRLQIKQSDSTSDVSFTEGIRGH
ncbi:hypothetical protein ACEPAH_6522 [Sanghuangporus vaninii]